MCLKFIREVTTRTAKMDRNLCVVFVGVVLVGFVGWFALYFFKGGS